MATKLLADIPPELLLRVTEYLPVSDVRSLSSVSSKFRGFLAPSLFRGLRATNREEDEDGVKRVIGLYGKCVEKVAFDVHLFPNETKPAEEECNYPRLQDLSPLTRDLLSGQNVPKLQALEIKFLPLDEFNADEEVWHLANFGDSSIYIHSEPEENEERLKLERMYQWRRDVDQVFRAVAKNKIITALKITSLVPRAPSIFLEDQWRAFLHRLENIDLHLWGGDNGAGWHSTTLEGYTHFIARLNDYFFQHLPHVTKVRLAAHDDNKFGCEGMNHTPLPILPRDVPKIREFELVGCFIDPALVSFLRARSQQLLTLRLIDCFSATDEYDDAYTLAENAIPWKTLFHSITESGAILQELELETGFVPLTEEEAFGLDSGKGEVDETFRDIREQIQASGNRLLLFPHGTLSDKYGDMFQNGETNLESFRRGEDQRAYEALMELVERNKQNARTRPIS